MTISAALYDLEAGVRWRESLTPASTTGTEESSETQGPRVHNYFGMTPVLAARALERVANRRDLDSQAPSSLPTARPINGPTPPVTTPPRPPKQEMPPAPTQAAPPASVPAPPPAPSPSQGRDADYADEHRQAKPNPPQPTVPAKEPPAAKLPNLPSATAPPGPELDVGRVEAILPEGVETPQRGGPAVDWLEENGTRGSLHIDQFGQRYWRFMQINGVIIDVTEGGGSDGGDRPWTHTVITEPGQTVPRTDTYGTTGVTTDVEVIGSAEIRGLRFQGGDSGTEIHDLSGQNTGGPAITVLQHTRSGDYVTQWDFEGYRLAAVANQFVRFDRDGKYYAGPVGVHDLPDYIELTPSRPLPGTGRNVDGIVYLPGDPTAKFLTRIEVPSGTPGQAWYVAWLHDPTGDIGKDPWNPDLAPAMLPDANGNLDFALLVRDADGSFHQVNDAPLASSAIAQAWGVLPIGLPNSMVYGPSYSSPRSSQLPLIGRPGTSGPTRNIVDSNSSRSPQVGNGAVDNLHVETFTARSLWNLPSMAVRNFAGRTPSVAASRFTRWSTAARDAVGGEVRFWGDVVWQAGRFMRQAGTVFAGPKLAIAGVPNIGLVRMTMDHTSGPDRPSGPISRGGAVPAGRSVPEVAARARELVEEHGGPIARASDELPRFGTDVHGRPVDESKTHGYLIQNGVRFENKWWTYSGNRELIESGDSRNPPVAGIHRRLTRSPIGGQMERQISWSSHVELKAIAIAKSDSVRSGRPAGENGRPGELLIVINHPKGPCPECTRRIPYLLDPGQLAVVVWPNGWKPFVGMEW